MSIKPFSIPTGDRFFNQALVNKLNRYAGRGVYMPQPLCDAFFGVANKTGNAYGWTDTATVTLPWFSPMDDGWVLLGAQLLAGTDVTQALTGAYVKVEALAVSGDQASTLGTFSARSNTALAGTPFTLVAPTERKIPRRSMLAARITHYSFPRISLDDCTLQWVLAQAQLE